jgi:hypothetical protein
MKLTPLLCVAIGTALAAHGGTATYTFEPPIFAVGDTTPMLNKAPNSGNLPGFTTSFTSSGGGADYSISTFSPNSLFSGQMLYAPSFTGSLILAFNAPINAITFVFAVDDFASGSLTGTSSSGLLTVPATVQGAGGFVGGTFSFSPATAFSSISLAGFGGTGGPTQLAIDNLTLTNIPEPSALIPMSLVSLAFLSRRCRRS